MLARTVLARLRAQAPQSSARDVAHISRQLAHTYLTSTTATTQLAIAPAVKTFRSYATATKTKTKPKPKSTTKKSPAKKTATRKTAAKKPVKKAVKKPVRKSVKKAVKKPVRKTAAKKAVKKPAPKRRPLTDRQKQLKEKAKVRENIAQLKATALEEPKKLPISSWAVFLGEYFSKQPKGTGENVTEIAKRAATEYKNMASSDLERLKNQAADNSKRNNEALKKWINSHSAQQIYEANKARLSLKRRLPAYKKGRLQDDRLVKGPKGPYVLFYMEKQESLQGTAAEKAKQAGQEWKALSAPQKQKYEDLARQDTQRYVKEYKNLYGMEPPLTKATA